MPDKVVAIPGVGNVAFPDTMSDDEISAQVRKQVLSQQPAMQKPEGAAVVRFLKGFWDNSIGGLGEMGKILADAAYQGMTGKFDPTSQSAQAFGNLITAHADQFGKAKQAWEQGRHSEAVAHTIAAAVPMLGPAAAAAGEEFGGQAPEFDKFGNVVKQGREPDVARGLGSAAGLVTSVLAPRAIPKTGRAAARGAERATTLRSQLNPVQQAAVDFADREGIPVPLSVRTGGRVARGFEALVENDVGGSRYAARARAGTTEALQRTGQRLAEQVDEAPATPHQAGQAVIGDLRGQINTLNREAQAAYSKAWEAERDPMNLREVPTRDKETGGPIIDPESGKPQTVDMPLPVDMREVKDALQPIYDRYMYTLSDTDARASTGLHALRNIINGDDFKPASAAELDLGMLKEAARSEIPELRDMSQGIAAQAVKSLDEQIRATMANAYVEGFDPASGSMNPALASLLEGRRATAKKWDLGETLQSFGRKNVEELEPAQVYSRLTNARDAAIEHLRAVEQRAPGQMPKIGRAYVQGLLERATQGGGIEHTQQILNDWNALGAQTKRVLFRHPGLIEDLNNFFNLARQTAVNPNPSGTALVMKLTSHGAVIAPGLGLLFVSPAAGAATLGLEGLHLIGNAALARLLFSPGNARLVMRAMTLPPSSPAGASAAAKLRKAAGDDAKPWRPPEPPEPPEPKPVENPPRGPAPGGMIQQGGNAGEPSATRQVASGDRGPGAPEQSAAVQGAAAAVRPARDRRATSVLIPGEDGEYSAQYRVRELSDLQASHHGFSFQKNPRYAYTNDRDYTQTENQMRVVGQAQKFNPRYLITDNPDAVNGPPVVDVDGNALGGNSRVMSLQRVYSQHPEAARAYRQMLLDEAERYGVDPEQIRGMKQPVLVREIPKEEAARAQQAITNLNKTGTAQLGPAEQAIVDSRHVSADTLGYLQQEIERLGEGGSAAKVLAGDAGPEVVNRLMRDGVITERTRPEYIADGKLTPEGKERIGRLMIGRFFRDVKHYDGAPAAVRNKLEKIASPLALLEQRPEWDVANAPIREGLRLLEEAQAHGLAKLEDLDAQAGMFGESKYSAEAYDWAYRLKNNSEKALGDAFRAYLEMESRSRPGSVPDMFAPPPVSQAEAWAETLGKLRVRKRASK